MKKESSSFKPSIIQFGSLAVVWVLLAIPFTTSAQSNTTRTRIRVPNDTPDPVLVAGRTAMDRNDYE